MPGLPPTSPRAGSTLGILTANPELARLVGAFACVTVAEWAYVTALSIHAYRKNGAIAVGFVGARLFLAAVSSLFSSGIMRRRRTGRFLSEIAVIRAAAIAGSAALAAAGALLAPLLVLLGLDAVVSAQYRPAQAAMIPALSRSPQEVVVTATALSTAKTLSQALGAVLGGALLAVTSVQAVFAGAAAVLICGAAISAPLGRLRFSAQPRPEAGPAAGRRSGWLDETVREVRSPTVAGILVASGLRTFVRGMWVGVAVIASLKLLHAGSTGVGLLMLAAGIGSLIAAPISSRLVTRRRIGTPAAVALVSCGIPLALIAGVPLFDLSLALVAAWGIGMAVSDVATSSILYRLVETPLLPRVTGTIESTKLALEGLGGFLAPLLASTVGIRAALLVAAVPLPLLVASGWKTLHRVDATAAERASLLELLHRVPCLEALDMGSLDSLVPLLKPSVVAEPGTEIIRQGEPGESFYIIKDGSAEVLIDGYVVNMLGRGQAFGERALLRNARRAATVRSRTPMQLLSLDGSDFLTAVTGAAQSQLRIVEQPSARGFEDLTKRQRVDHLSKSGLLSHLDSSALRVLADKSVVDRWSAGATIVQQGDEGDRYFLLLDGSADVVVDGRKMNEILPGDQFGEISLLHSVPRRADVVASTPAVTLSLHRDDFVPAVRARLANG